MAAGTALALLQGCQHEELSRIGEVANELKRVLDDAKKRQREKLRKSAGL
jgi:hypothetical protein